ncbi:MAG: hypothetical protein R6X33_05630 [Candidatus Brocadiia bacterium]
MKTGFVTAVVLLALLTGTVSAQAQDEFQMPRTEDGWTELTEFLVPSDGSRSLGDPNLEFNDTRDPGSKIVFFDAERGDNATGELYWWDGDRIVDSTGSPTNDEGEAYGTNPLLPNEAAIEPFHHPFMDPRFQTHKRGRLASRLSQGYPDWFLLRRGQVHETFEVQLWGGRSISEPMVVAGYGPTADGRAIVDAGKRNPFSKHTHGQSKVQFHQVLSGLELHQGISHLGMHEGCTSPGEPGVPTWLIEDCKLIRAQMNYLPIRSTVRRSVSAFNWKVKGHNQGYWNGGFDAAPTFEEVIFYKNGFKEDPRTHADPRRTIFDRNIYQGGGAQMGHTYRNIISATGGSGSPQMRYGGLIEDSLIIEGYWYSSTRSTHGPTNAWLVEGKQRGRSAVVRNNVQFIYQYPSPNDPDTDGTSDRRAQFGGGYNLAGASFGALIENNIVSGALMANDLGFGDFGGRYGFKMGLDLQEYQDGKTYTQQRNTLRGNIAYRTRAGLALGGSGTDASGHVLENNVFAAKRGVSASKLEGLKSTDQLVLRNNRIYAEEKALPEAPWIGSGNEVLDYPEAAKKENWPDPDRTLKRYVTEELGLTLLDWSDDPWLPPDEVAKRVEAGEAYDPTGVKTFMAVATNMRKGGTDPIPESGKPSWIADYPWDARFTGVAVVNWIRAGFGMEPVGSAD